MADLSSVIAPSFKRSTSNSSVGAEGRAVQLPHELMNGLAAWHCATHCKNEEGGEVATWKDLSGNERHAHARPDAAVPTFSSCGITGHPAVQFGKGQVLVAAAF